MKLLYLGAVHAAWVPDTPFGFESQADFDFPETKAEIAAGWSLADRCGKTGVKAGSDLDQRIDTKCPNIILMNTDDMSWADVSINNPSKQMPTPNIDRLVSKGINFRDGHSCTSRCAPSRYCLMSGRYHFRRGDYHYKPMDLEYGRKVLPHIFKRNNYATFTVGKPQPVEDALKDPKGTREYYFEEGTRYWGFDRSFSSRSYCCLPGGGYFENDRSVTPFDRYSVFMDFRMEDEKSVQISPVDEEIFWQNQDHWHLLDGFTEGGDPNGNPKPSTYKAYWNMIKNGEKSGLNQARRRRTVDGKRIMRHTHKKRRRRRNVDTEHHVNELLRNRRSKGSFVRFQNSLGQVMIASHAVQGMSMDRLNYEFAVDSVTFESEEAAREHLAILVTKCENDGSHPSLCQALAKSQPKKTQIAYDSRKVMKTFRNAAIGMINDHVAEQNPNLNSGQVKNSNRPFFMYLSWRAPHRPMSHDWDFDPANPQEHMPYVAFGKPGEQLGIFDRYVGDVMRTLEENNIADNTLVLFTSDNGPDGAGFAMLNKMGHMRLSTLRGAKASVYEGGHRVPFLSWWPAGIHKGLHGTNYDLPVSQTDFFATFADIMDYPLPGGDQCIYGYDSSTAHVHGRTASALGRKVITNCIEEEPEVEETTLAPVTENPFTTLEPPTTTVPEIDISEMPGYDWIEKCPANGKCNAEKCVKPAGKQCDWRTCEECTAFWQEAGAGKVNQNWVPNKINAMCQAGKKCVDPNAALLARSTKPVCQYTSYAPKGSAEHKKFDYGVIEQWQAQELQTGFLLGWQGCMAEDSHSFASAFKAKKVKQNSTHQKFETELKSVETKIFAGKLGDLSLRLGRYKLVRYNAPKDIRAGPTRQHLTDHHGAEWLTAGAEQCSYDVNGTAINPGCTVEPQCRDFTTFGQTFCMRDHYYELWDLEKNFGEKVMCDNTKGSSTKNLNYVLENALLEAGAWGDRGTLDNPDKGGEKSTDPYGYTLGRELSPVGRNVNDCCLLNYDEKAKWLQAQQGDTGVSNFCGSIRFKDKNGDEKDGGVCKKMTNMHSFFKNNPSKSIDKFREDIEFYIERRANWGWGDAEFAGFSKFDDITQDDFEFGWGCSNVMESKPSKPTFIRENGEWRPASMADKFCIPSSEDDTPAQTEGEFQVGCKVPDHNGPLAAGWEVNHQWDESLSTDRQSPNNQKNGELRKDLFGDLFNFSNCLANVLKLIEGAAYRPETQMNADFTEVLLDRQPIDDNGAGGVVSETDDILAGAEIGSSKQHKNYLKTLWKEIAPDEDFDEVGYHGAGSRYFDNTRLAEKCLKFLPNKYPSHDDIKPNFDVDMNLLGYYDTKDNTGGQNTWLLKNGDDDRQVQKYYKADDNQFLYAFTPQYNL